MNNVIVIGGGAAGMQAAVTAAENGAAVTLLERNEKLGKKVYITGKGRCNVTNACDADEFLKKVVKNPRFLYSAMYAFPPEKLMAQLESWGCPLVVERGERVYPESQKASDVTRAFEKQMSRLQVKMRFYCRVQKLWIENGAVRGVILENGEQLKADRVIVATGGQSYPSTGSTGDGWQLMAQAGHTLFPALPSLVGLRSDEAWVQDLQGLSLKNVRLTVKRGKKKLYTEQGEMLFTHLGISGPLVLSASAYMAEEDPEEVQLSLDLKPALNEQQLEARILRDIKEMPKKQIGNLLMGLFPASLARHMGQLCQLETGKISAEMTREERNRLIQTTKMLVIPISGLCTLKEAVVTRGGVSVKEIDPGTMESKLISGLYAAGELLDVDALTGGFNLQIAFATGHAAGLAASESTDSL